MFCVISAVSCTLLNVKCCYFCGPWRNASSAADDNMVTLNLKNIVRKHSSKGGALKEHEKEPLRNQDSKRETIEEHEKESILKRRNSLETTEQPRPKRKHSKHMRMKYYGNKALKKEPGWECEAHTWMKPSQLGEALTAEPLVYL